MELKRTLRYAAKFMRWQLTYSLMRGLPDLPTPREKAWTLIQYGSRNRLSTLVETGTYRGETVAECLRHFDRIFTIELDPALHAAARARFAGEARVTLIQGDSCSELSALALNIAGPALFWLDAHYSAGVTAKGPDDPPLRWELQAIARRSEPDVVLIDDVRLMGVNPGYPSLEEIRDVVGDRVSTFDVRRDILRITLRCVTRGQSGGACGESQDDLKTAPSNTTVPSS